MRDNDYKIKQDMARVLKDSYERGWITSRDGNVSYRGSLGDFYITPSGVLKYAINVNQILTGKMDKEGVITLNKTSEAPSGESAMHLRLHYMKSMDKTCAVLHLHPTYTVSLMTKGVDLRKVSEVLQELTRYTKVGPNVPALPICSTKLARETNKAFVDDPAGTIYDIVGQVGHGVTAIAPSIWEAFEHVERLEHACEIIIKSGIEL